MTKASLIFSICDKVGGLTEALEIIKEHNLNMCRIESRPSKTDKMDYDFFVDFEDARIEDLDKVCESLRLKGIKVSNANSEGLISPNTTINKIMWFPRKISDLDEFSNKTLDYGAELNADHPGFTDPVYRERRKYIAEISKKYRHGQPIPRIEYTEQEISTWRTIYTNLKTLYKTHACRQHNYVFPLLEANCGYGPDNIPQLEDVSKFLQECTGFRLRPVQGLLTSRDFLNGLAFRVFHSTQYIRHHSQPFYTPEPDVCHELLGHVPLFADPDFADFSQEIGLASLGASDDDIEKLATCYWFSVEFGLCKEDGKLKAYGAGLLSSFGELKYCLGEDKEKPEYKPFDPSITALTKYPITSYQPIYFVAESFQDAKEKLIEFSNTLDRPFSVRYNALTQSIEILDSKYKLIRLIKDLQNQLSTLNNALTKMAI
jgi:phenylalanine-4-hydroxylase